ncbi:MAG: hypothetical protein ABI539_08390 [Acidobacteriota bacterium]
MKFSLPKPLGLLNSFGRMRFTGTDFLALVHAGGIELILSSKVKKGRYYYSKTTRKHVIVLATKISRAEREQVGWHEFAHFLQNYLRPVPMKASYCAPYNRTRKERFADLFAFVCVTGIPICGRMDLIETLMTEEWK